MQTVTSGWAGAFAAPFRLLNTAVLISWNKTIASGVNFFTVNTSAINGSDFIKGGGDSVTFFDKYDYKDYTSQAKTWSVSKQLGNLPYGMIMAQADVELDNNTNLFTPNYDATIGSGILPNRPLKLSIGSNAESISQFVGFTGQPELTLQPRQVTLHAFDAMDYINNYSFTTSGTTFSGTLQNVTASGVIGYYLEQLGFSKGQYYTDKSLQSPIGFVTVQDRKLGDVFRDLLEAEGATMLADENGKINFWNRQHFQTASGTGFKFNLNYSNVINIEYANTPIINDVIVTASPRAVQALQQIWSQPSETFLNPNTTTDVFVDFTDTFGALPVTSVTPPINGIRADSYFVANTSSDGSGSDVGGNVSVTSTYLFGTTYKITFRNTYANGIYLTSLVLYGRPANVTASIQQRYTDPTSIANYGRNPSNNGDAITINNDYIQDASSALSLAYILVTSYKDPRRHYKVDVFADPSLQIGDFGSLYLPEVGQTKQVYITGITNKLANDADLQQTLLLEERPMVSLFTINVSTIGGADSIAA